MNNEPTFDLIAACAFGLEAIVRRELESMGLEASVGDPGKVHFQGSMETICRANLWLRTADRVLIQIARFPAADFDALFESTRSIRWGDRLPSDAAFPVTGRSVKSQLSSVPACQRAVKRAIVDAMRRDHGVNELPESGPEYKIDIGLLKDTATLTVDTTGRSLHRRGYRTLISRAPLKETLAAAMVMLSFWKPDRPLLDPFCGSGTIPIEAAMIGRNLAPGRNRSFACEAWHEGRPELWLAARDAARQVALDELPQRILGSDIDGRILKAARENAEQAEVASDIHFEAKEFRHVTTRRRFGCLITNPPYGQRLGETRELDALYQSFPEVLRQFPTWSHYFLTAYQNFENAVGKSADRRRKLYNGRIECTYYQFHGPRPVVEEKESASERSGRDDESVAVASTDDEQREPNEPDSSKTSEEKPDAPQRTQYVHAAGDAAFGQLDEKAAHQAELFAARLRKRARHLRRWPTRREITCFRLYERDIPEIPLVVDRYEDYLHLTEYERPHDRDPAQHANWLEQMARTAGETLEIPDKHVYLKRRSRQRGSTQHDKIAETNERIEVREGGLKFLVNLADYVDTGLFLDHRTTRAQVRDEAKGKRFLNLFAYTGSFTVYAADGAASETVSVDLSRNYLDWARDNLRLNGLDGSQHRFVNRDAKSFLSNHRPGEHYDLVVLDPPTFSNSKRTEEDWNIQTDAVPLLNDLLPLVAPGGVIYFSTNFRRFKFDEAAVAAAEIHEISKQTVPEDFRNRRIHRCWRIVR